MNKRIFWKKVKQQGSITSKSGLVTYIPVGSKRKPKLYQVQVMYGSTLYCFKCEINKPLGNMNDRNFMNQHSSPRLESKTDLNIHDEKIEPSKLKRDDKTSGTVLLSYNDVKNIDKAFKSIVSDITNAFKKLKGVFKNGKKARN